MSLISRLKHFFLPGPARNRTTCEVPPHNFILDTDIDLDNFPKCPRCRSDAVAMIIYGSPMMTTKIHRAFETGQLIAGGCMVRKSAPAWHCHGCQNDFGKLGSF